MQLLMNMIPSALSSVVPTLVYTVISFSISIGSIVYFVWALYQFKQQKTAGAVFKAIGVYICTIIAYATFVGLVTYYYYGDEFGELINL